MKKIIKILGCIIVTLFLVGVAYVERGYFAIGFEYIIAWLMWLCCWAVKDDEKKEYHDLSK